MLSSLIRITLLSSLATAIPIRSLPARSTSEKTITHQFTKVASKGNSVSSIRSSLTNTDLAYMLDVSIGTPPQALSLQLDTGSSDVWAVGPGACSSCTGGTYDASKSSSAVKDGSLGEFEIAYFTPGSGVNGTYYTDTVTIGGQAIQGQVVAEASSAVKVGNGIIGVGPQALESDGGKYPDLLSTMVNDGLISKRMFSLALHDISSPTGNIVFGGYDAQYESSLVSLPIVEGPDGAARYYINWSTFSLTDSTGVVYDSTQSSSSLPDATVLDSGYTASVLPNDIYSAVASYFGVGDDGSISCDATSQYSGSFQFGFGQGPDVTINVDFANSIAVPDGSGSCFFGFEAAGDNAVISLGDTFLRSAYVVYDVDDSLIALAQGAWTK